MVKKMFRKYVMFLLFMAFFFCLSKDPVNAAAKKAGGGSVTVKADKARSQKRSYTKADLRLMSSIINCEAGIEPYQGKVAVGIVVMNRVASKSFPNSIRKVIYQKGQFTPTRNGSLRRRLAEYDAGSTKNQQWKDCIRAAKSVLEGKSFIIYKGNKKNMSGYHFFSVHLSDARFRLGGHRFK